jgi:hypothetical protein
MKYVDKAKEILRDGSTSYWLKDAIRTLNNRDVIDALNDIEVLQELLVMKFDEAKKRWEDAA